MSSKLYLYIKSGICNQLFPLISAIRIVEKTNRDLYVFFYPIQSYNFSLNHENTYIYNYFNIKYHIQLLKNNNFPSDFIMRGGDWGAKNNRILNEDIDKNVLFYNVCHCLGVNDDNIQKYQPFPFKKIEIDIYLTELRNIIKAILIPIDSIKNKINETINKFNTKVLGIHIRSIDGTFGDTYDENKLFGFIDNFLENNKNWKIYISADDIEIEKRLINKYNEIILYLDNPFGNNYSDKTAPNHYGTQNAVCELYILAKCDKIMGSTSSSFSFFSWLISDNNTLEFWNE